jgi:hypothetical protein
VVVVLYLCYIYPEVVAVVLGFLDLGQRVLGGRRPGVRRGAAVGGLAEHQEALGQHFKTVVVEVITAVVEAVLDMLQLVLEMALVEPYGLFGPVQPVSFHPHA